MTKEEVRAKLEEYVQKEQEALEAGKPLNSGFVLLNRGIDEGFEDLYAPKDSFFRKDGLLGKGVYQSIEDAYNDYDFFDGAGFLNYELGYVPDLSQSHHAESNLFLERDHVGAFKRLDHIKNHKFYQKIEGLVEEFRSSVNIKSTTETQQLQKALQLSLEDNALTLPEIQLNQENWNKLFPEGKVETPVGTVKLGAGQFYKLQGEDRNNLLGAMYQTLATPDLVLEKETLDKESGEFKPVNVYGKSFVRNTSDNKRMVESVVIFRDGNEISISTHNKDIGKFMQQIKTADQVIFADPEVSRVASLILKNGGSHVRLEGIDIKNINTQVLNEEYNKESLLSIKDMIERGEFTTKPSIRPQEQESPKIGYQKQESQGEGKKPYYQKQVENLLDAVKSGKVPFLPQEPILGEDGKMISSGNYSQDGDKLVINPRPAVRMLSGNILTGMNQLTAQIELDKMGRKSQTVLTWEQAKAEGCYIKKDSRSFVITGYDKNVEEGQSKARVFHVFSAGDVKNRQPIQDAMNKNANANSPKLWTKETLSCHDSTPEKFLGTYMAASSTGAKFETDRATAQQFKQQFTQMMEKSIAEKQHTAIFEVGRNAQKYASAIRENGYKQWEKEHNKEREANTRNLQQRAKGMEMGL